MVAPRENEAELIAGRKHTGKSTYGNARAVAYPKNKKVLICDVNKSPAYSQHAFIDAATLQSNRWKSGIVRYYERDKKVMFENVINHIDSPSWKGGLIIFEDCTKYIPANPPDRVKSILVDHRMFNADLIFTFHSFKRIPAFFWEMANYVTILKTQESFDTPRNRDIIPNFDDVARAREKVMAHPNNYYKLTIPTLI